MKSPWEISIEDLLIYLDLPGLFTGTIYKISAQYLYQRSPYKMSWCLCTSCKNSMKDLFNRKSLQDLFTKPLSKIPIRDLYVRPLYKTSLGTFWQDLYKRSLAKYPLQNPSQKLCQRSLWKIFITGIHFTRPLKEIFIQDLLISLDLLAKPLYKISLQEFSTKSLRGISVKDPHARSLYQTSWYLSWYL